MLKQATLHQLKLFEAIARSGSFTRAAEELFLTQPTVFSRLSSSQKQLGCHCLVERLYLTDAGQEVLRVQDISEIVPVR